MGHALMENRSGLIVETATTLADGHAERRAALAMINRRCPGEKRITLGADKLARPTLSRTCAPST